MINLTADERKDIVARIEHDLRNNTISLGDAVKRIRTNLYFMTQTQYARFIKVSDKTLRDIEKGNTDPRLSVLNKILAPAGFKVSAHFVPRVVGE